MVKIELTTWERIQLDVAIPRNAPLAELKQLLRIADAIVLTDGEKDATAYQTVSMQTPQGPVSYPAWNNDAEELAEVADVSFEDADFDKLVDLVDARQSWPLDRRTLDLQDKLDEAKAAQKEREKAARGKGT